MNLETIDARIKEKLEPHLRAVEDGTQTDYDILPAVLSTLLNQQKSVIQNQSELDNLVNQQAGELKLGQESSLQELLKQQNLSEENCLKILMEIHNTINEINASYRELTEIKFSELKLLQESSFQKVLNSFNVMNDSVTGLLTDQSTLKSTLLAAHDERLSIRKISIANLIFSVISAASIIAVLVVLFNLHPQP